MGESLKVGDTFPQTSFKNQFEQKVSISKNIKQFIVVFSKDDGEKVKIFLEKIQLISKQIRHSMELI